jgi:hypothetical protein
MRTISVTNTFLSYELDESAWSGVEVMWKAETWKTDEKDTRITFTMKMDAARPSETLILYVSSQ